MPQPDRKLIWLLTVGCFFAFFIFGFTDNIKGPTLPFILRELNFNYSQGGTILLAPSAGILLATILAGILSDVAGKKAPMFGGAIILSIGILSYSLCNSLWGLTVSMLVLGFGLGSLHIGANAIIVDLHRYKASSLNLLHFFYGMGSMIAPIYALKVLAAHFTWRHVYLFSLPLVVVLFLFFLVAKYPHSNASGAPQFSLKDLRSAVLTSQMGLFYLLFCLCIATEVGIASWLVEFLQQAKSQSDVKSRFFLFLYFGGVTFGRFLASFVVERVDYLKMVLIALLASTVCLTLGIFGPLNLVFFVLVTGFFFSIILPTIIAQVSNTYHASTGTILGLLFAFGAVGGMLGPWLIGKCSDWWGIRLGFSTLVMYCFIMVVSLLVLMKKNSLGRETV